MTQDFVTYGNYAAIRDAHQMKDSEVANASNVGQSTFSDWKSGRSAPKVDKLKRIAAVLGVTIEDLIKKE